MAYTPNYNFYKPSQSEQYDIEHQNSNMDLIDTALQQSTGEVADLIQYVGDLANLTTDEKSNIVGALNEIDQNLTTHLAESVTKADVIQTTEVNDSTKVPSSTVTYGLQQSINGLNAQLPVYTNETQAGIADMETFNTLEEFINALPPCLFIHAQWALKSVFPELTFIASLSYEMLIVYKPHETFIKIEVVDCNTNDVFVNTKRAETFIGWKKVTTTNV